MKRSEREVPTKTYRIPFRSFVSPKDTWLKLFENIRAGKEKLVTSKILDGDIIEIHTVKVEKK